MFLSLRFVSPCIPLGRPRRRWEDNIKIDLQGVGGGRRGWMELAQDKEASGCIKYWKFID
jgi:hypothetical protein